MIETPRLQIDDILVENLRLNLLLEKRQARCKFDSKGKSFDVVVRGVRTNITFHSLSLVVTGEERNEIGRFSLTFEIHMMKNYMIVRGNLGRKAINSNVSSLDDAKKFVASLSK